MTGICLYQYKKTTSFYIVYNIDSLVSIIKIYYLLLFRSVLLFSSLYINYYQFELCSYEMERNWICFICLSDTWVFVQNGMTTTKDSSTTNMLQATNLFTFWLRVWHLCLVVVVVCLVFCFFLLFTGIIFRLLKIDIRCSVIDSLY